MSVRRTVLASTVFLLALVVVAGAAGKKPPPPPPPSDSPSAPTAKTLRSPLPAFVTSKFNPSSVRTTDPCEVR